MLCKTGPTFRMQSSSDSRSSVILLLVVVIINSYVSLAETGPVPRPRPHAHPYPYYKAPDSNRLEAAAAAAGNNSLTSTSAKHEHTHPQQSKVRIGGCRYQASVYSSGDLIPIEEPCLNCQCKHTAVVCKLRICPDSQSPPPPGCIMVHKANKCCPQIVCPENNKKISREHRLSSGDIANITMNSLALPDDKGFCVHEGTVYAEGSAMRSSSLCEHCFCIRGQMKCSSPQCVIPLDGCKPRFRSYACCPTNYDCNDSNSTAIIKTTPASTPIPQYLKGCQVSGRFVREGEPVLPLSLGPDSEINPCQTCFCMGGVVRCRPLECDKPLHGCRPIIKPGHCCPDRYECPMNATAFNQVVMDSLASPTVVLNSGELAANRVLTSTEIHAPLALDQNTVNEILSSRIANSLKQQEQEPPAPGALPLPSLVTSTEPIEHSTSTFNSHVHALDLASREDRRSKDAQDYVIKISRELLETDDQSSNINNNDNKGASSPIRVETQDFIPDSHVDGQLSDLITHPLTNSSGIDSETDGDELTIALEVITENDVAETTVANNLSIISTTEALVVTTLPSEDLDLDANLIHANADGAVENEHERESETTTEAASTESQPQPQPFNESELPSPSSAHLFPSSSSAINSPTEELSEDVERTTLAPELGLDSDFSFSWSRSTTPGTQEPTTATTVNPPKTSTSTRPTTIEDGSSLTNLQFIPFGVEDAMFLKGEQLVQSQDSQDTDAGGSDPNYSTPIKITFDNTDNRKASLIAPSPGPPGYVHVPLVHGHDEPQDLDSTVENENDSSGIITSENLVKNIMSDPQRTVFDVPVSTSLYNNGYFPNTNRLFHPTHQNKSIFDHIFEDSSERRFEDDADDERDEEIANGKSENATTITSELNTTSDLLEDKTPKPPLITAAPSSTTEIPTTTTTAPSRIYSKFDINDSPYYNRFGESGYELAFLPVGGHDQQHSNPSVAVTISPGTIVQVDHHRYYDGPDFTSPSNDPHKTGLFSFPDYTSTKENDDDEFVVYEDHDSESGSAESDYREPSFSSKLDKVSLPSFSTSTVRTESSTNTKTVSVAPKKKPQYYSKTPASTIKPIVVNTPRPSAPSASTLLFSPSVGSGGFKPVLSFPFVPFPKNKPLDALLHIGLKLSGCNIYGKMYGIGNIIRELSSSCIQCQCTEIGVQCSEIICDTEDMIMMS